jgi:hypothetical protein
MVLMEAASRGEIEDVLAQLPAEYYRILVGAWGQMPPEGLPNKQYRQLWEEMRLEGIIWRSHEGWLNPTLAGGPQAGQQFPQGWQRQQGQLDRGESPR